MAVYFLPLVVMRSMEEEHIYQVVGLGQSARRGLTVPHGDDHVQASNGEPTAANPTTAMTPSSLQAPTGEPVAPAPTMAVSR